MPKFLKSLILILMTLLSSSSFAQTYTTGVSSFASSISSVSSCGDDTYYFSFVQAAWQNSTIVLYEDATVLHSSTGWTASTGAGWNCWTPCRVQSSTSYGTSKTLYCIIDAGANTVVIQTTAPTCCTAPTISGSVAGSRCETGTVEIQATASGGSIEWYAASTGGSSLGSSSSGVNWTTPSISSTTTYYAEAVDGACTSASRTAVTATVSTIPTVSGSVAGSRCNTGTVEIQATASGGSIDWYAASSGGASLGSSSSGVNWTTPSISSTTIYYAEAIDGSCTSASRTAVTATVNTASEGPAGFTDELFLWLKADAGTNSIGTSWEDQSCNGFDYTTVAGPTKETSDWNYNAAIEILSGGFNAPAGAELGTDWTIFFVSKLMASDNNGRLIDGHSGDYLLGYQGGYRNGIYWDGSPSEYTSGIATTSDVEQPHIYTYVREDAGSTIDARVDGDALKTFTSTNSGSGIRLDINQGANSAESSDSRIGEFIIFNKELSDAEIIKIESYLAIKYGISMSDADGGAGGDYVSSGGTTYWDASINSNYNNEVVVIGKDATSGIDQKQSKSPDDSVIVFISSLAADNSSNAGTITNDESFITIGHNGGELVSNATSSADMPYGIYSRFEREWRITNTNFDDNFSLELEWDSSGVFNLSELRLLVDDDGDFSDATIYSSEDGITFSIGSIIIGGISTSFIPKSSSKYITIGSSSSLTTLPVELLFFEASELGDKVVLSWETAAEVNNDYFIVEKSSDGINWKEIIEAPGAGNSNESTYYSHLDYEGCSGTCYYRLTQVDFDGTKEEFKSIVLNSESDEMEFVIQVSPNPVIGEGHISFTTPESGVFSFMITAQNGQLIYQSKALGARGTNYFNYSTSLLSNGVYYFTIQNEAGEIAKKVVVK